MERAAAGLKKGAANVDNLRVGVKVLGARVQCQPAEGRGPNYDQESAFSGGPCLYLRWRAERRRLVTAIVNGQS